MAQTIVITDDLDGSPGADTVHFTFDGVSYEVDLSKRNRTAFAKAIKPYVDASRKVSGRSTSRSGRPQRKSKSTSGGSKRVELAAVRAWAHEQGIEVSERGRVAASVIEAYQSAH